MKINNKNIMLLGVPRSGTTLACHLLNKSPNAIALHEPLIPKNFINNPSLEIINKIELFINMQRKSLIEKGTAVSKTIGGIVPDNHLLSGSTNTKKRVATVDSTTLLLDKMLPKEFFLIIKHCSFFVGILELLVDSYKCYAVIRNPLSSLLSWNSVELQVAQGYAPAAENFDSSLNCLLHEQKDKYKRQLLLLAWFYNKIYNLLPKDNIIKYEDIISTNGRVLQNIIPEGEISYESLNSKNNNALYDSELAILLADKLLKINKGSFLHFYNKEDISQVLEDVNK